MRRLTLFDPTEDYDVFDRFDDETIQVLEHRWFYAALCVASGCVTIWLRIRHIEGTTTSFEEKMVYPPASHGARPSVDMPASAQRLYEEAGNVLPGSPRAAAALLRMCTEDIIKSLTPKHDGRGRLDEKAPLYKHVEFLQKNDALWPGEEIDTALEILRLIGNEAVHSPRMIQRDGDSERIAKSLFMLVDMITQSLITRRRETSELKQLITESDD